jgi:hypothetical protein
MIKTVYIDTSVIGGNFDEEFKFWTELFFKEVKAGRFQIVISVDYTLSIPLRLGSWLISI